MCGLAITCPSLGGHLPRCSPAPTASLAPRRAEGAGLPSPPPANLPPGAPGNTCYSVLGTVGPLLGACEVPASGQKLLLARCSSSPELVSEGLGSGVGGSPNSRVVCVLASSQAVKCPAWIHPRGTLQSPPQCVHIHLCKPFLIPELRPQQGDVARGAYSVFSPGEKVLHSWPRAGLDVADRAAPLDREEPGSPGPSHCPWELTAHK